MGRPKKQSQGLGDTIEKFTEATGIKKVVETITKITGTDCGCDGRIEWLNRLIPYKHKLNRCFTNEEYNWYSEYLNRKSIKVQADDVIVLCELHASLFNFRTIWYPCPGNTCSPKPLIEIINRLDLIHKNHKETIE